VDRFNFRKLNDELKLSNSFPALINLDEWYGYQQGLVKYLRQYKNFHQRKSMF